MAKLSLDEERSLVIPLPEKAKEIKIENEEDRKSAGTFLHHLKEVRKRIDDKIDPISNSAYKALKGALSLKKELVSKIDEAELIVKPAIAMCEAEKERQRLRLQQELRKEAEDQATQVQEDDDLTVEPIVPVVPKDVIKDGIIITKNWKYRVENIDKVPRVYLILDEKKVGAIVRALKDKTNIEGIIVYSEDIVSVRDE